MNGQQWTWRRPDSHIAMRHQKESLSARDRWAKTTKTRQTPCEISTAVPHYRLAKRLHVTLSKSCGGRFTLSCLQVALKFVLCVTILDGAPCSQQVEYPDSCFGEQKCLPYKLKPREGFLVLFGASLSS